MSDLPIVIGGLQAFASLANPANTAALRATGRVGLYAHVHSLWQPYAASGDTLPTTGQIFAPTGSYVAELDYTDDVTSQAGYFGYTFTHSFWQFGSMPDEALVNGFWTDSNDGLALANWRSYMTDARAIGISRIEPIFTPNMDLTSTFRYDLTSFMDPIYDNVRAAALYGGGLGLDTPPSYVQALAANNPTIGAQYLAFVEQEIDWANANGIRSTVIISPYSSGLGFMASTQQFVARLEADKAVPQQYVVEDYGIGAGSSVDQLTTLGSETDTNTLNGVALWLAQNAPTTPFVDQAVPNASAAATGGSPAAPAVTAPSEPAGLTIVQGGAVGQGTDALMLDLSTNQPGGAAVATITLDGQQLGSLVPFTASPGANDTERFTFYGDFGAGQHTVGLSGLGLVLNGASYDGTTYAGIANAITTSFVVGNASTAQASNAVYTQDGGWVTPSVGPVVGSGPDSIVLSMAEDAYKGDAQFTVSIDGRQFGGVQTVTSPNASGQFETFTLMPTLIAGQHTITVNFLNPTQPGGFVNARNLYVTGVSVDGTAYADSASILDATPTSFVVGTTPQGNAPVTLQDGQSITTPAASAITVTFTNGTENVISTGSDTLNGAGGNEIVQITGAAVFKAGAAGTVVGITGPGATVMGGSGSLTLSANSGNSVISTQLGTANSIGLGSGSNSVNSAGSDTINGTSGNQTISLTGASGVVDTGFGGDAITTGAGSYQVSSFGSDTINAGSGSLTVLGGSSSNNPTQLINGGSGSLLFAAGSGAATVHGGTGSDIIYGGSAGGLFVGGAGGHNTVVGGSGSDTLSGGGIGTFLGAPTAPGATGGNDLLQAGSGTNVIYASSGDSVFGGPGSDTIWASQIGGTTVLGGTGHAVIYGQASGDVLYAGGSLGQTVVGGNGNESLSGGQSTGNNTILGGSGSEVLVAGLGNDSIVAGTGSDSIFTGPGRDTVQANSGLATIAAGSSACTIWGGAGSLTVFGGSGGGLFLGGSGGKNALVAGSGNVTLAGSGFNQQFGGTAPAGTPVGNDTLAGGSGNDVMYAGSGDYIFGGNGQNTIFGAASGGSSVVGGAGSTLMVGQGDGNVFFAAGAQGQTIQGGAGRESLSGGTSTGAVSIVAGSGNQVLVAGSGSDTLIAGAGNDSMFGGSGHDTIIGGCGNATVSVGAAASITGGTGAMTVFGGTGNDTITGGAGTIAADLGNGNDTLQLGAGAFTVFEGSGVDTYMLTALPNTTRQDTFVYFQPGHDSISLKGGLTVTSQAVSGATAHVGLSDGTQLTFLGLTNSAPITFK